MASGSRTAFPRTYNQRPAKAGERTGVILILHPQQLRAIIWHEMAHWLYYSAQLNSKAIPALKAWRAKIDAHWASRTKGEIIGKHQSGWKYIRDGWISDYAGRLYPGQDGGIEIPSVYLEKAALGPDQLALWCEQFPDEKETFDIALSLFEKNAYDNSTSQKQCTNSHGEKCPSPRKRL